MEAKGKQVLLWHMLTSAALPSSCEVACLRDTRGFSCPSTYPCHNGGVFQASQGSCSCPPGWMVRRLGLRVWGGSQQGWEEAV